MMKKQMNLWMKTHHAHGMDSVTITEQDILHQLSTLDVNKAYGLNETPPNSLSLN